MDLKGIASRNATDLGRAFVLIPLGLAAMAGILFLVHRYVFPGILTVIGSGNPERDLLICDAVLLVLMGADILLHPTWPWIHGWRWLGRSGTRGRELSTGEFESLWNALSPYRPLGILKMFPMVASFTDPHNRGVRRLIFLGDIATIPLFGARIARAGLEHLACTMRRGRERNIEGAKALLNWIRTQKSVPERRLAFQLSVEPDWVSGLALARNMDLIARSAVETEFVYRAK